ncbi:hypothetical protein AAV35_004435 [Salimicrobium jeotgali]|uniref:RNA polymerase sigma factor n=1 Tax=Salimicrobium jeotgali TaxID=1230341 RepID=K2GA70_9BACI|nr:sigma-70 family RNA polymerase sigma factor [Salimicrobium jeotgali]AKG04104.1 hypothetical protein AAV35_004435 [Salimicrobium jeotgali]EKE31232.1 RNA polymerase sigma factor [Salimicrobium jeotgali]MBM7697205.1 RNA polymerase sigma factor (sigma-70 family) [Salimicrobium jeotgali]
MKNRSIEEFRKNNPTFMQQPIVRAFLQEERHLNLLQKHLQGDHQASILLDEKFRHYFYRAKIVSYLSNLIHYFSIDYDKRKNVDAQRFPLILNKPLDNNQEGDNQQLSEVLGGEEVPYDELVEENLEDVFTNPTLSKAVRKLTRKQKHVLSLFFIHELNNKEIAAYLGDSEQNVSNLKTRALQNIEKYAEK